MKKSLALVVFVLVAIFAVGCGKGTTGFDKPEDLGSKIATLRQTMEATDFGAILEFVYFAKAEDKVKVETYFAMMEDFMKQMIEIAPENQPKDDDKAKFAFKEAKVEGDKGEISFSDGSTMKIVKVENKWYLSSEEKVIQDAIKADLEASKKQMQETIDGMKKNAEAMKNMPKPEDKKEEPKPEPKPAE